MIVQPRDKGVDVRWQSCSIGWIMPAPVNREAEFPTTRNSKEGENYRVSYYCAVMSKIPVRINLSKEFMPALKF